MFTRQPHSTLGHAENNSRLWGEGGQRPGEGALANGDALRVALRLRAEQSVETLRHSGRAQREPESSLDSRPTLSRGQLFAGMTGIAAPHQGPPEDFAVSPSTVIERSSENGRLKSICPASVSASAPSIKICTR